MSQTNNNHTRQHDAYAESDIQSLLNVGWLDYTFLSGTVGHTYCARSTPMTYIISRENTWSGLGGRERGNLIAFYNGSACFPCIW